MQLGEQWFFILSGFCVQAFTEQAEHGCCVCAGVTKSVRDVVTEVTSVIGGACENDDVVWLVEKARVPVCCHSQRFQACPCQVCGVLCEGEMRVMRGEW